MISCGCRFDEDGPGDGEPVNAEPLYVDADGDLVERRWVGGQEVIVHHANLPERDITIIDGIPCTTALRAVIDVAPDVDEAELDRMVADCLRRRLFSVEEAQSRIAEPDMVNRRGAALFRESLDRCAERGRD